MALSGCALQRQEVVIAEYDFGSDALPDAPGQISRTLPPLTLEPVRASAALQSNGVSYRLLYANAQQVRSYALARWRVQPAQLVEQRLRAQLSQHRAVLVSGDGAMPQAARGSAQTADLPATAWLSLRIELDEFSHLFAAPNQSSARIRLRATLRQHSTAGEVLLAQRSFTGQQTAATPDAQGGVQALTVATDQVAADIERWISRETLQLVQD